MFCGNALFAFFTFHIIFIHFIYSKCYINKSSSISFVIIMIILMLWYYVYVIYRHFSTAFTFDKFIKSFFLGNNFLILSQAQLNTLNLALNDGNLFTNP